MDRENRPVAGVDYPRAFQEMDVWFWDETARREHIRRLRRAAGFVCPHRGVRGEPWMMSGELMRRRRRHKRVSLTAGAIFEGARKPLRTWFMAMWFVTSQENGVSALGLKRALGLGGYETARVWPHKLRRAMVRPGRDRLGGAVEADETYVVVRELSGFTQHAPRPEYPVITMTCLLCSSWKRRLSWRRRMLLARCGRNARRYSDGSSA